VLEAVGVHCRGVRAAPGVTAAGDAIADRPRTVLEAVASGLRAGREAGSLTSS
jgi:glycerol-3-phosphate dehydrogenase subunit B